MLSYRKLRKVSCVKDLFTDDILCTSKVESNKNSQSDILDNPEYITYREKISTLFDNSNSIKKSTILDEFYFQDGIKYLFKKLVVDQISNKPMSIINPQSDNKKEEFQDNLAPPYDEDILIEEDFGERGTHRLLFNRYSIIKNHVVLVTRNFTSQFTHLTYEDCSNSILLMKKLNAVVFFNGGKHAGCSQPRKHLQAMPIEFLHNGDFGLFLLIENHDNLDKINSLEFNSNLGFYNIKQLKNVNHVLIRFEEMNEDIFYFAYNLALNYLELLEDEEQLTKNYSLIFYNDWLLLVARQSSRVYLKNGYLDINSIGLLFNILIKSDALADELKNSNLIESIFNKL